MGIGYCIEKQIKENNNKRPSIVVDENATVKRDTPLYKNWMERHRNKQWAPVQDNNRIRGNHVHIVVDEDDE